MLSIILEGPPFERGFQHGKQFAREIEEEIQLFCPDHWLKSSVVAELDRRLLSSIAREYPELVLEMIGISKGSGIGFDQITLLNLVLATNDLESDAISSTFKMACSAIGFSDSDVGPVIGKNCDERRGAAPFYVFQQVYPEENLSFMGISNVGTVWLEAGINEAGFAFMQTAGPIAPNQSGYGIACNIAPRPMLSRCHTTDEGISMIRNMYVAGWGMGIVLADLAGHIVALEKTGDLCAVSADGPNPIFCTNHFVHPLMEVSKPIAHEGLEENSKSRYKTLGLLLQGETWPKSLEGMKGALGYHGEAGFVCQHGNVNLYSNYSCIAIMKDRKILLGDGYPCQSNYSEYYL
jgi:Acyl-coenzyme A:6-aminopenicillanic acid acyl-transferase